MFHLNLNKKTGGLNSKIKAVSSSNRLKGITSPTRFRKFAKMTQTPDRTEDLLTSKTAPAQRTQWVLFCILLSI